MLVYLGTETFKKNQKRMKATCFYLLDWTQKGKYTKVTKGYGEVKEIYKIFLPSLFV